MENGFMAIVATVRRLLQDAGQLCDCGSGVVVTSCGCGR